MSTVVVVVVGSLVAQRGPMVKVVCGFVAPPLSAGVTCGFFIIVLLCLFVFWVAFRLIGRDDSFNNFVKYLWNVLLVLVYIKVGGTIILWHDKKTNVL